MAVYSITPSNVVPGSGAKIQSYKAGAAMDAGESVYISDSTTSPPTIAKADANDANKQDAIGVLVATAEVAGQIVGVQSEGDVVVGTGFTQGDDVCLANTAGKMIARGELSSGDKIVRMGTFKNTTTITIAIKNTGIAVP